MMVSRKISDEAKDFLDGQENRCHDVGMRKLTSTPEWAKGVRVVYARVPDGKGRPIPGWYVYAPPVYVGGCCRTREDAEKEKASYLGNCYRNAGLEGGEL